MSDDPVDEAAFSITPDEFARMQKNERAIRSLASVDRDLYLRRRCHKTSFAELAERHGHTAKEVAQRISREFASIDRYMAQSEPRRGWRWRWWPWRSPWWPF